MPEAQRTTPASSRAVDPRLFLDPLGYLRTEIYRQRVACNTLEALACSDANGDVRADAERVQRYIVEDLPLHLADLEESLIPLLEQRAQPGDDFEALLAEHRSQPGCEGEPLERLVAVLRRVALEGAPPAELQPDAGVLIGTRRRDLAWENDVILPLAEERITGADLETLGKAMADRRGVPYPR